MWARWGETRDLWQLMIRETGRFCNAKITSDAVSHDTHTQKKECTVTNSFPKAFPTAARNGRPTAMAAIAADTIAPACLASVEEGEGRYLHKEYIVRQSDSWMICSQSSQSNDAGHTCNARPDLVQSDASTCMKMPTHEHGLKIRRAMYENTPCYTSDAYKVQRACEELTRQDQHYQHDPRMR